MTPDFRLRLIDGKDIEVVDYTERWQVGIPEEWNAITLDITSSKIPNYQIDAPLDMLAYLYTRRVNDELYIVKSEDLGLGYNESIPDGIYTFTYTINNTYSRTQKFAVTTEVDEEIDTLLQETNDNVEVGNYDIEYTGTTNEYDLERVSLVKSLREQLDLDVRKGDEVAANNTLDKLQRLLNIIRTDLDE